MPTVARPFRAAVALALAALTATALQGTDASGEPPGAAAAGPSTPELSETSRLSDRRSLVVGDRAYAMSTADGLYPAAGWHIRGEMGGVWTPPISNIRRRPSGPTAAKLSTTPGDTFAGSTTPV